MACPTNVPELEELLSRPTPRVVEALARLDGDLILLGVGGKMGPTLARMARRASDEAGRPRRIWGVSRFSDRQLREELEQVGVETIACDLLDEQAVGRLPDAANVLSMVGFKFGASRTPEHTWAINCYLPALVCRRYRDSRIAAFSTGNVYGPVAHASGGSKEDDVPRPVGEYAMTALGRERMYQYFSLNQHTRVILLRLNYATELRYGVLVDLAQRVQRGQPVDVRTSHVNVIWLADANAMALASLEHAAVPARIVNLAGPDIVRVRELAARFGQQFGVGVACEGEEQGTSLLNDGRRGAALLGPPALPLATMIEWTAEWLKRGGPTLGKPTHFEVADGKF